MPKVSHWRTIHRLDEGFSLLEMVVTVSVFAVMTAIAAPHLLGIGTRAQEVASNEDVNLIRAALTEYYLENHVYPTGDTNAQLQTLVSAELLDSIPVDPTGGTFVITDSSPLLVTVTSSAPSVLATP